MRGEVSRVERVAGSFRDPDGFVFRRRGVSGAEEILRQVNPSYAPHLPALRSSGLLDSELVLPVEWLGPAAGADPEAIETLRPEPLDFVSHPYEWSFGMIRDAALLTLDLAREALGRGLVLKDASAYNVAFQKGKPVHFDTLSFETYVEGEPWIAYGQFCRHFLAPLALMSRVSPELLGLLRVHLDGIPLPLAASLLPGSTKLSPGLAMHLHAHARASDAPARAPTKENAPPRAGMGRARMSRTAQLALLDSLRRTVEGLTWIPEGTTWAGYTDDNNYAEESYAAKKTLVDGMLSSLDGRVVWDLGANTGDFSRLAAARDFRTLACDLDPAAVERNYRRVRADGETRILPLLQDLSNPSPDLGWAQGERPGLLSRANADVLLALALIHHLRIGGLVPLARVAALFADLLPNPAGHAIVEWVPKEDSQIRRLLSSREDVFADYDESGFEGAFADRFETVRRAPIPGTVRTLYHFRRR